jgi:hypothetical protein
MGQTVGGQIGRSSIELLQIGSMLPLTQRHTHAATAVSIEWANIAAVIPRRKRERC